MRVLWFAAAQLPAAAGIPRAGGGWVEGLRRALEEHAPEVELGIASPGRRHEPFSLGNATYFHVHHRAPAGRVEAILDRWRADVVPDGALERCAEIARSFAPDLVHIHGTEHYFGLVIPRLAVPATISLQGIAAVYERYSFAAHGLSELLREVPTSQWVNGYGPIHAHRSMHARAGMERMIIAACDDFMGRTEWDRAVLKMLRPQARYHEVGEVLGEPFYQTEWHGAPSVETVFCTGGASALKGVECLLEALVLLRGSGVRRPRLRLAGGVTDGVLGRKVRRLLDEPGLRGAVDVVGACTPARIAEELAGASAFVLPSHMDNSPNALCEAMLVGTPCIAAFVGGVPSLVKDGVNGLLYHDADPFALAGKIDQLLGDRELAVALGAAARATALQRHDAGRVADQAVEAYRDVLRRWDDGTRAAGPLSSTGVTQ